MIKKVTIAGICIVFFLTVVLNLIKRRNSISPIVDENSIRIVSLSPYVTENLYLLGFGKNIVGLTIHEMIEKREGKEIIGTLIEPNIEKIVTLKPDIVIASKEGNRQDSLRSIQQLGIKTLVLDELHSFDDICKNFTVLGKTLGEEKKAVSLLTREKKVLEKIKETAGREESKKVFFILGFKPLITTGRNTYINEMIFLAGGTNIFQDVEKKWFACSLEEVVKRNPDVIISTSMEKDVDFFGKRIPEIEAVQKGNIFEIDDTVIGSPTPESFISAVKILYGLLHSKEKNVAEN